MEDAEILKQLPEIKTTNQSLIDRATTLSVTINNETMFKEAGLFLVDVDRRLKWWNEKIDPVVDTSYRAHKQAVGLKKEVAGPLETAKRIVGDAMAKWNFEQRQKAAEETRKLEEQSRKLQEDAAIAQAQQLHDAGHKELAESVISQPIVTPSFKREIVTADGVGFRTTYSAEVMDIRALIIAAAAGTVPLASLKADTVFLNKQASALKHEMKYPGVRVKETSSAAVRS